MTTIKTDTIESQTVSDVHLHVDNDGISKTIIIHQDVDKIYLDPDAAAELCQWLISKGFT